MDKPLRMYDSCWRIGCEQCPFAGYSKDRTQAKPNTCLIPLTMDTEYNEDASRVCKANQQALARVGRAPYIMNRFGRV